MTQAAARRGAWGWDAERKLIADRVSGVSLDEIAARQGRTKNAIEQKLSELRARGELAKDDPADRVARRTNQDPLHVIACLGQGGFPTYNELVGPRGWRSACLPLIWPRRL